jgi:hypothetical protein
MKTARILPLAFGLPLGLALASCAVPTGPTVVSIASDNVSDTRFANNAAACRANAQSVVDAAAASGALDLQNQYDQAYARCLGGRGYQIEIPPPPGVYYSPGPYWGPGPRYYPGPSVWGPYPAGAVYVGGWRNW